MPRLVHAQLRLLEDAWLIGLLAAVGERALIIGQGERLLSTVAGLRVDRLALAVRPELRQHLLANFTLRLLADFDARVQRGPVDRAAIRHRRGLAGDAYLARSR